MFYVVVVFFAGLQPAASKFFIYCLTLALTTLSGASIAFAFSALVSVFAVANLLVSLVFILYMVRSQALVCATHWYNNDCGGLLVFSLVVTFISVAFSLFQSFIKKLSIYSSSTTVMFYASTYLFSHVFSCLEVF